MACQFVLRYTSRPSKLPAGIFFLVCASANMLSIVDLMLRTPRLAEPLQDAAKSGHALAELVRSTLLQHQPNPQGYSYGMSGSTMLFGTGSLLGFTMMVGGQARPCWVKGLVWSLALSEHKSP